jgi:hypothetical protein
MAFTARKKVRSPATCCVSRAHRDLVADSFDGQLGFRGIAVPSLSLRGFFRVPHPRETPLKHDHTGR